MQLNITPVSIASFTHNAGKKMLYTEISNLGSNPFKQLYDDACDLGIAVYNRLTGSVTYWYVSAEARKQGELTMWILQPTIESCRKHPSVQHYVMHIIND